MAEKISNIKAFVVGYTGQIGLKLIEELVTNEYFSAVKLVGRREVEDFKQEKYSKFTQHCVNFEKLEDHPEAFNDTQVGFCTLGTTRAKSGADGFRKVDFDFVLASAKAAKSAGVDEFHLVTSQGSNKDAFFLYPKTKGEIEEAIKDLGFDRYYVYRPAFLIGTNRDETRVGEKIAHCVLYPVIKLSPTSISVPIETVAKAMVNICVQPPEISSSPSEEGKTQVVADDEKKIKIFENKDIHQYGAPESNDNPKQK